MKPATHWQPLGQVLQQQCHHHRLEKYSLPFPSLPVAELSWIHDSSVCCSVANTTMSLSEFLPSILDIKWFHYLLVHMPMRAKMPFCAICFLLSQTQDVGGMLLCWLYQFQSNGCVTVSCRDREIHFIPSDCKWRWLLQTIKVFKQSKFSEFLQDVETIQFWWWIFFFLRKRSCNPCCVKLRANAAGLWCSHIWYKAWRTVLAHQPKRLLSTFVFTPSFSSSPVQCQWVFICRFQMSSGWATLTHCQMLSKRLFERMARSLACSKKETISVLPNSGHAREWLWSCGGQGWSHLCSLALMDTGKRWKKCPVGSMNTFSNTSVVVVFFDGISKGNNQIESTT